MHTSDIEAQSYMQMGHRDLIRNANDQVRLAFVRKVYIILSCQLLLTVAVAAPLHTVPKMWFSQNQWLLQLSILGSIVATCVISQYQTMARTFPVNYMFLFGFTLCEALCVGVVSAQYTAGSLCASAAATAVIFVGMTIYAWTTKSDFTGMGPFMVGALLALLSLGLMQSVLACCGVKTSMMTLVCSAFGVLLFTMWIIYDTQLIIGQYKGHWQEFSTEDYVPAAINLYLDIMIFFG